MNRRVKVLMVLGAWTVAAVSPAQATWIPQRTVRASVAASGSPDGASSRPAISPGGTLVAFDSLATNLAADPNGAVRDVFLRDLEGRTTTLVSTAPGGGPADGPSDSPVVAGNPSRVIFTSTATNLVAGDTNGVRDVFVRVGTQPVQRLSVASGGAQADGASFAPDASTDSRLVVFSSLATNLVPGDTNGVEDVFLHDLFSGSTRRISQKPDGSSANGSSRAPAISPDGGWVSFESGASDLVAGDDNQVRDVFLFEIATGRIQRVSVDSAGRAQNQAVAEPFVTASDVSSGGRFVTWDSDADNLVAGDLNLDTDIFVRDVRNGRTSLASRSLTGKQGNNDSYFPAISSNGRYVAFTSFARNYWPVDAAGEDLFMYDRRLGVTVPLTVTSTGGLRGPETDRQLLRRASLSDSAHRVAFTSSAPLTSGDDDSLEDAYVRLTSAPDGRMLIGPPRNTSRSRPRFRLDVDDPAAVFICRVDRRPRFFCPLSGRLPTLSRGRHRFSAQAGGPGMLFDASPNVRTFRVR